jgi:hypothetical protein
MDYSHFTKRIRYDGWQLLRDVLQDWQLPIAGKPRVGEKQLARAEARLGFALPESLKALYRCPWNPHWTTTRLICWDLLRPDPLMKRAVRFPTSFRVTPTNAGMDGFLPFLQDGYAPWRAGFRVRDASEPDPPVWHGPSVVYDPETNEDRDAPLDAWQPHQECLSQFMLHELLNAIAFQGPGYGTSASTNDMHCARVAAECLTTTGFPPWMEGVELFGGVGFVASIAKRFDEYSKRDYWDIAFRAHSQDTAVRLAEQLELTELKLNYRPPDRFAPTEEDLRQRAEMEDQYLIQEDD